MVNPRVFFDFSIDGTLLGRVVFELFKDKLPLTVENFRSLCTGEKGISPKSTLPLWYKGSTIHRVIDGFMIQGGDFTRGDGKGGESIYGKTFPDEDLSREIDNEGLLCMANKGKDTNGSQYFITLRPCPHLNGKHVVFGKVVSGYETIVKISKLPVAESDVPLDRVVISHCGELELRKKNPATNASPPKFSKKRRSHSESESESDRSSNESDSEDSESSEPRKKKRSSSKKEKEKSKSKSKSKKRSKKLKLKETTSDPSILDPKLLHNPNSTTQDQEGPGSTSKEGSKPSLEDEFERQQQEDARRIRIRELEERRRQILEEMERENIRSGNGEKKDEEDDGKIRYKGRGKMKADAMMIDRIGGRVGS